MFGIPRLYYDMNTHELRNLTINICAWKSQFS